MTVKGDDVPEVVSAIEGDEVTVYEVIGSLEKGAVKVKETVVEFVTVAVPTVGALGTEPFPPELELPKIGIVGELYLTYQYFTFLLLPFTIMPQ